MIEKKDNIKKKNKERKITEREKLYERKYWINNNEITMKEKIMLILRVLMLKSASNLSTKKI